jgi:hypothetical protein
MRLKMSNVVDLSEIRRQKEDEEVANLDRLLAEEDFIKLLQRMGSVEKQCKSFWLSMSTQQRMMAFYVISGELFKAVGDGETSLEVVMRDFLGIESDTPESLDDVIEISSCDVVWDLICAGYDAMNTEDNP